MTVDRQTLLDFSRDCAAHFHSRPVQDNYPGLSDSLAHILLLAAARGYRGHVDLPYSTLYPAEAADWSEVAGGYAEVADNLRELIEATR